MNVGVTGSIPDEYVTDAEVRLNLYARLAKLSDGQSLQAFEDELQDRFGPLPRPVQHLLQLARAKVLCRAIGITRVDAGPKGIALSCRESDLSSRLCVDHGPETRACRLEVPIYRAPMNGKPARGLLTRAVTRG